MQPGQDSVSAATPRAPGSLGRSSRLRRHSDTGLCKRQPHISVVGGWTGDPCCKHKGQSLLRGAWVPGRRCWVTGRAWGTKAGSEDAGSSWKRPGMGEDRTGRWRSRQSPWQTGPRDGAKAASDLQVRGQHAAATTRFHESSPLEHSRSPRTHRPRRRECDTGRARGDRRPGQARPRPLLQNY